MAASPQHPFTVEIEDGTVIGGAQTESDAVTLAAGAVAVVKGTLLVRDSSAGTVTAQIGRLDVPQPAPVIGPILSSINPASTAPGLPPQVLTCTGSQFEDGVEIFWDDVAQPTTFSDATQASARLDVAAGSGSSGERVAVRVQNPDGRVSGTVYFQWE